MATDHRCVAKKSSEFMCFGTLGLGQASEDHVHSTDFCATFPQNELCALEIGRILLDV